LNRPLSVQYDVRHYSENDEPRVLELLQETLGPGPTGHRSPDFLRWKHFSNPFGSSLMLVAEAGDRIIGLRAFLRWQFRSGDRLLHAAQAVDTSTSPDFQGIGVFSRLTREAIAEMGDGVDLIFNTPNKKSLPGYLKMGWSVVGSIPVCVRVRRPVRFLMSVGSLREAGQISGDPPRVEAERAADALHDPRLQVLLEEAQSSSALLSTARTVEYLRWRYGFVPSLRYHALREESGGRLCGLAIFRIRARGLLWETCVTEIITSTHDRESARKLLRRVVKAAQVDHVTCHPIAGAAVRSGFFASPVAVTLTVNQLDHEICPPPTDLRSWALSLGDLEVF
jgi:hypothetical protein